MPRVSIIIPTFNQAEYVTQAIECVLAQTYSDTEVIVVDDGSTDDTPAVLSKYLNRIKYIRQNNKGISAARNIGIDAAQGKYLLFLDGDDLIPPEKIGLQLVCFDADPKLGIVYSGWEFVAEDGVLALGSLRPHKEGNVLKELLCRSLVIAVGSPIIQRVCFDRVGGFDESLHFGEDTDMWIRIALAGFRFGYVDEILFRYRIHPHSTMDSLQKTERYTRDEFSRLERFYADSNLPADIRALKPQVFATASYETAARYYRMGDDTNGKKYLAQAIVMNPIQATDEKWLLDWIAGAALDPRTWEPINFIDFLFDHLPPEATPFQRLRKRAQVQYHLAGAFSAYQQGQLKAVRQNLLPAILGDPSVLRNRGVVSIGLRSLFS